MNRGEEKKRRYVYHKNSWFFCLLIIVFLIFSFTPGLIGHNHVLADISKDPLSSFSIIAYLWAFFLLHWFFDILISSVYYSRPIELDEEGIRSFMGKDVFREIKWKDVVKIRVPRERSLCFLYINGEWQNVYTVYGRDGTKIDFFNDILYEDWRERRSHLPDEFAFAEIVYYIFKHINVEELEIEEYRDIIYLIIFFKGKITTKRYKGYPSWWETLMKYVKEKGIDIKLGGNEQSGTFKDEMARLRKLFGNED